VSLERRAVRAAPAIAAVALVAGLASIVEPDAYPSYDYVFAMASAQDLLAGRTSGYDVLYSPVPHPLTLLEALAVVPLGELAFPIFTAVALLALGLLCWSLFRIGAKIASWPVGLLAAALVFTSPAIFELAVRAYGDIAFAALVAAAIALEVSRTRRGWPVLAVLAVAGLLRPEAWLLSAAYWLFVFPSRSWRERVALGALVALAPAIWIAMDILLTGDPLHAVAVTRAYTESTQASLTPDTLWVALRALAGWPVIIGAVAGAVIAWRRSRPAAAALLVASLVTLVVTVAPALLGDSAVLRRFMVVQAAVASLFFAIACLGWMGSGSGSGARSRVWRIAGLALAALTLIVLAGSRADLWNTHHRRQAGRVQLLEQLQSWATAPAARAYLTAPGCWPVRTPGYGYRPYLRYWLDVPPRAVAFRFEDASPEHGTVLLPTTIDGYQRLMLGNVGRLTRERVLGDSRFDAHFRRVARSTRWELYASRLCRRSVQPRVIAATPPGDM
jgi:hypothetical protein